MTTLTPGQWEKARAVGAMFDGISRRYDLLNRVMSAGLDGRWRTTAVRTLTALPPGPLLDIGAGTGDLALTMRRCLPAREVVGLDLSAGMLRVGVEKLRARGEGRVGMAQGDVLQLPLSDESIAGAATAFTMRNVADPVAALAEVLRVLCPGGVFAILEITRPAGGVMARLFNLYFGRVLPRITGLVSGNPAAYRYLPESVERFMSGGELLRAMRSGGFTDVRMRRFWPGAVTLHTGRKPGR